MAKSKNASPNHSNRKRKKWPRNGSLKLWLECYLDSCEQLANPSKSAIRACVPLRQLAECGFETQALKRLDRLSSPLDPTDVDTFVRVSLIGAEISLENLNLKRAHKYLAAVEARLPDARPSKKIFLASFVEKFRTINGLVDETGCEDALASIGMLRHQYRRDILDGDERVALASLRRATKVIPEVDDFILERTLILSAIKAFHRLGKDEEITRYVGWIDRNRYSSDLDTGSLAAMGFVEIANSRAEKLINRKLKQLKADDDPNVHFPVNVICSQLWFFIQTGEPAIAARLMKRVLRDLPKWQGLRAGFATSGSLTQLAEVIAELDGPDASLELLGLAVDAGSREVHRGFRKSAVKAAEEMIETPGIAAAINRASSARRGKKRRENLVPLYAKSGNWKQLAAILDDCSDVDEVNQLVHATLFALQGGARL